MTSRWAKGISKRKRWSRNALAKRAKLRIERALSPQSEQPAPPEIYKIKPARFAVKINLERADGMRIQFTCHRWDKKLMIGSKLIAPREFGRRLLRDPRRRQK